MSGFQVRRFLGLYSHVRRCNNRNLSLGMSRDRKTARTTEISWRSSLMGDHSRMKRLLKSITNWICLIIVFPFFLAYSLLGACGRKDSIFASFSQFFSLIPGRTGSYLRKGFYRFSMTQCDKDCAIVFGTIFSHVDTEIGKGAYIGAHCNIGMCKIEKH